MNALLLQAIRERRRIAFSYHGRPRVAEPQCYGAGTSGKELLRVHQLQAAASASHCSRSPR